MVLPKKARAVSGIRILDESKISKNEQGFKAQGKECATMSKLSRDVGRISLSRKPVLVNVSAKSTKQIDLENDRGKMKNGRKALADISNLNNRSLQCTNKLGSKPKLINLKDTGTKKVTLEGSKMSRGNGRFSVAKGIVIADLSLTKSMRGTLERSAQISGRLKLPARRKMSREIHVSTENHTELSNIGSEVSKVQGGKLPHTRFVVGTKKVAKKTATTTTRKPIVHSSKLRTSVMTRHASISKKLETTKHSGNKDPDEPGCKCNRRKSYTLSLVIRRSCDGLVKNDLLANIDNFNNPLEVADYVDDIYEYYWTMEVVRPTISKYTEIQSDVTPKMRSILVNWLIEVHHKYKLMEESLFLMIELLDRLLSAVNIKKNELQLFGLTTLLLASKYEDYWHPKVSELISLLVDQFTKDEMLGMEIFILKKLQFRLNVPTSYVFMLRFLRAAQSDKKLEDLSFYLIELCLVENESLKYKPSLLCASAIFVARSSLRLNPPWTGLLLKHARYEESELRNCAEMILSFQRTAAHCRPVKYTYLKYLKPDRSCVASLKPMKTLPP
ncbi:putative cyclin-B3-1 [Platanthera zijinensis]|uniref:Cyclin-B3-1 n=1 Tax=Platanthera zijinensis TaxID=2320716 RepID=A0AAP0BQH1_9ASPA